MFVYVIRDNKDRNSSIKIGTTRSLDKRLKQLQTGYPEELSVVHAVRCENDKNAHDIERNLHIVLDRYRLKGEWFHYYALAKFRKIMSKRCKSMFINKPSCVINTYWETKHAKN